MLLIPAESDKIRGFYRGANLNTWKTYVGTGRPGITANHIRAYFNWTLNTNSPNDYGTDFNTSVEWNGSDATTLAVEYSEDLEPEDF